MISPSYQNTSNKDTQSLDDNILILPHPKSKFVGPKYINFDEYESSLDDDEKENDELNENENDELDENENDELDENENDNELDENENDNELDENEQEIDNSVIEDENSQNIKQSKNLKRYLQNEIHIPSDISYLNLTLTHFILFYKQMIINCSKSKYGFEKSKEIKKVLEINLNKYSNK